VIYDEHADSYAKSRRPDRRIAARIDAALGDARTVVNVGAGTGSYEPAGLAEMQRVARDRVVIVAFDPAPVREFWMVREYFPAIAALHSDRISSASLAAELPSASLETIPVPRDCADLFFAALWARPELLLDPDVVRPMWVWQSLSEEDRRLGGERLAADLASGAWEERHGDLRQEEALDVGLRLIASCNR
jgi:hypothetical protein